jgi:hypothetical protein
MAVTPVAGLTSVVVTGGTPVLVSNGGDAGGFITNPSTATESIFVDPVGAASLVAQGTTFEIVPGSNWEFIAGQTTPTSVNAATNGHEFSCVRYS